MITPASVDEAARETAAALMPRLGAKPSLAVVLGTGWDPLAEGLNRSAEIPFEDLGGFAPTSVPGHAGTVSLAEVGGAPVLLQSGRLHYYEGHSPLQVTFPVWVYGAMGVEKILVLSAAGGLNPVYGPGNLIIVRDHIFLWGDDPLTGVGDLEGRDRFMPHGDLYPERLQEALEFAAGGEMQCERGVYAFSPGPTFETGAEATLLRVAGADIVGMSVAPEIVVARYLGMETAAMCCVSNSLLPFRPGGVTHASVLQAVRTAARGLEGFLEKMASFAM